MNRIIFLTLWLAGTGCFAQLTPGQSLSLREQLIEVPAAFRAAMPGTYVVNLPPGYKAGIFYAGGLSKPRFLSFDAHGVLHVADQSGGRIYAMPDKDADGVADTLIVAADGFTGSHDVKFYNGWMYVTEEKRVWKLSDENGDGVYEKRDVLIDNIAQGAPEGGHRTRSIAIDSLNGKLYVSVGSACNACREEQRAIIEQYDMDGTNRKLFASGVRNAVGITLHPVTNRLWANNNGSDNLGNDIPPEWIDVVREDGFYGYPFAYGDKTWVNFQAASDYRALLPITAADSAKVDRMIMPAAQIEAHSAPMGIAFLNSSFPANMRNGMITALRGSWNAPGDHRGYKLIYVDFTDAFDTVANYVADFCTGFITDTVNRVYWARPVGLAIGREGEVYMSSDEATRFILRIYRDPGVGLKETMEEPAIGLYPNPAGGMAYISLPGNRQADVRIMSADGREVQAGILQQGRHIRIETGRLPAGVYLVRIGYDGATVTRRLLVQ